MTTRAPRSSPTGVRSRVVVIQLLRFLAGTVIGLVIDFGVYTLLTVAGLFPVLANVMSSACAVVFLYFFSSRVVFNVRTSAGRFIGFCVWYAASIVVFSLLIQWIYDATALSALSSKAVTLPLSFTANFFGSRFMIRWVSKLESRWGARTDD
jgi:putative flippase GtrA